jgi:hypothetical protein
MKTGITTIHRNGDFWRYLNGKLHREDGPAVIFADQGYKAWWVHDVRHREDGPALIHTNGANEWWLHGKPLSFDDWLEQTPGLTGEEKVMYKLEHG